MFLHLQDWLLSPETPTQPNPCEITTPQSLKPEKAGRVKPELKRLHEPSFDTPFVCEICGDARRDRWKLNRHMSVHTDEKHFR
mmetsp:Transcript_24824/g.43700  ORF Transcript_24824/g.43700 Transcript_24824/m.43700 type:complete len:83 (-) Transcript_24824:1-249(-)